MTKANVSSRFILPVITVFLRAATLRWKSIVDSNSDFIGTCFSSSVLIAMASLPRKCSGRESTPVLKAVSRNVGPLTKVGTEEGTDLGLRAGRFVSTWSAKAIDRIAVAHNNTVVRMYFLTRIRVKTGLWQFSKLLCRRKNTQSTKQ